MNEDERVLCIRSEDAEKFNPMDWLGHCQFFSFPRSLCETNEKYRQLIPYCAVQVNGKFLVYRRKGNEDRLHGLSSFGIGGHIAGNESIVDGMWRELREEAGVCRHVSSMYLGKICLSDTPVNRVHLGLAWIIVAEQATAKEELIDPRWMTLDEIEQLDDLEPWSKQLAGLIRNKEHSL